MSDTAKFAVPLPALQAQFQAYILGTDADEIQTPPIASAISEQSGLPAEERLAIYFHAYRIRLREALAESFSKTHAYMGDDLFAQMCDSYADAQPSRFRNLRWYGDQFPSFLADALSEHPVVAELAAFEWALGLAFDASDAPVLTADEVRTIAPEAWEHICFTLQPSLQILELHSNAIAIWLALDKEQDPPDADIGSTPLHCLIWRKQLQPHFRSMDRFETLALQNLQQGRTFTEVCEMALSDAELAGDPDLTPKIAGWLQTWLNEGVLSTALL